MQYAVHDVDWSDTSAVCFDRDKNHRYCKDLSLTKKKKKKKRKEGSFSTQKKM